MLGAARAEARYEALFREMLSGMAVHEIVCDETGRPVDYRFLAINPAFERLTGLRAADIIGRRAREVIPGLEPVWIERYGRVALTGIPDEFTSAAGDRHFEVRAYSPRPSEFAAIFHDVTEPLRAAQQLRRSEERFRTLFEHAGDAMFIHAPNGRFLEVNLLACERLGYTRDELLALAPRDIVGQPYRDAIEARVAQTLGTGLQSFESIHVRRDGSPIPVEITSAAIDFDGQPAILNVARDISKRRLAEEQRDALEGQLRQAHKMEAVGQLAGGIAHDFNNLMTAIGGCAQLALDAIDESHPARPDIDEIVRSAARAAALTRQLLAFARRQALQPEALRLDAVVNDLKPMLGRLIGEHIRLVTGGPDDLGTVLADRSQVEQIVVNLVVNARDAMPSGGVLEIRWEDAEIEPAELKAGGLPGVATHVLLAVSDTGVGMDEETRLRAFDPFFTTKAAGKGTGLGLATVYGIVRQSGGAITVTSEPGRGSTFEVYLPRIEPAVVAAPEPRAAVGDRPSRPRTVLVVEDEDAVRGYVARVLVRAGHRVLVAEHGQAALRVAAGERIHLLLTDIVMPDMNGRELADHLQAVQPGMVVLFMSGYSEDVIAHHGVLDPGIRHIQKPFSVEVLTEAVSAVLDEGSRLTAG